MDVKVLWVSEKKTSKKGKAYWSVMVANSAFKSFGIAFEPVEKGAIVAGQFDLTGKQASFIVSNDEVDLPF